MKITFGIISNPDSYGNLPSNKLNSVFESIANDESYDDVEIIVVGGNENKIEGNYRFISFDETTKSSWITKKKNIITQESKYDIIVYMHDYISLVPGWFKGMEEYGENFNLLMTKILNADNTRFRDWTLWGDDLVEMGIFSHKHGKHLLPYSITNLSKCMYFSGAYWIAKRSVMEKFPLDEKLRWGEGEDVKWSKQVRQHYDFQLNEKSSVKLLKQKDVVFSNATPEIIRTLNNYVYNL